MLLHSKQWIQWFWFVQIYIYYYHCQRSKKHGSMLDWKSRRVRNWIVIHVRESAYVKFLIQLATEGLFIDFTISEGRKHFKPHSCRIIYSYLLHFDCNLFDRLSCIRCHSHRVTLCLPLHILWGFYLKSVRLFNKREPFNFNKFNVFYRPR